MARRNPTSTPRAVPPPTTKPTDERAARAEAIEPPDVNGRAYRPWWRVETRLEGLCVDKLIDQAGYEAACRLRTDFHIANGASAKPARSSQKICLRRLRSQFRDTDGSPTVVVVALHRNCAQPRLQ